MNGVIRVVMVFIVGFFVRTGLRMVTTGDADSATAAANGSTTGGGFAETHIEPLLEQILGVQLSPAEASVAVAATIVYAGFVGFVARIAFGSAVFAARLNGVIALFGAWASLGLFAALAGQGSPDRLGWVFGFAAFGSIAALALAAGVKAFVAGEFDAFMTGGPTRIGAAVRSANAVAGAGFKGSVRANAPSADRINLALSRSVRSV